VWLARSADEIAYALVAFADARPVTWREARDARDGSAYPVDSGTGCFADAATAALVRARENAVADRAAAIASATVDIHRDDPGWRAVYDREHARAAQLLDVLVAAGLHERNWANVCVDPESGANLIAFHSGAGDGSYTSYFGFDASGALVALVTDFGLDEER
jgi:hypothetical protein